MGFGVGWMDYMEGKEQGRRRGCVSAWGGWMVEEEEEGVATLPFPLRCAFNGGGSDREVGGGGGAASCL